jgi:hypothetical protein
MEEDADVLFQPRLPVVLNSSARRIESIFTYLAISGRNYPEHLRIQCRLLPTTELSMI